FCLGIKKCSNAAFKFKMPNIPDFSIEVGLFGVQVLCYGALTIIRKLLQELVVLLRSRWNNDITKSGKENDFFFLKKNVFLV
ncbi:hypothetical protein, partial [Enterococcus italicus]|uniref:hypothetical protein n=1 Tax=Enterococcus italicus TaxID=246144 RepID=UPI002073B5C5